MQFWLFVVDCRLYNTYAAYANGRARGFPIVGMPRFHLYITIAWRKFDIFMYAAILAIRSIPRSKHYICRTVDFTFFTNNL